MTKTEILMTCFTGRLDSCQAVTPKLEPVRDDALTFAFEMARGVQMVVTFQANYQRPDRPFVQAADLRQPSLEQVMDAVQEMYAMVAWNGSVLDPKFNVILPREGAREGGLRS